MSKLAERIYDWWVAPKPQPKKRHRRNYAAARLDRLNSQWTMTPLTANYILRADLRTLRARAREMCRNAPHFKKFLSMARSNIVGPQGLRLQCRARKADGSLNTKLNKRIEEAFWAWGHRETCSASGKLDWIGSQKLFVTQLARDGEVLVQKLNPPGNPYGFALKFWDVSYLDETYDAVLPNGNRVSMSVEIDADDKPVAYWLTTPSSDILFAKRRERNRTRVPVEQMNHAFLVYDDESQLRGVTWFHAALLDAKNLHGYKEGVITSAKMAAMSGGFFTKAEADETELMAEEDEEGNETEMEIDLTPASFWTIPDGYDFRQFDPKQPTQNHEAFYKSIVRDVAAGLDVPYFDLQGDLSDVNYSSARVGLADSRDIWRGLQDFVAGVFCREIYHEWCHSAVMTRMLTVSPREYMEIQNPVFRGRGWQYIDPQKEITANVTALENKLASWTEVLAERGVDLPDHLEVLKAEQELAAEYGIDLSIASKQAPAAAAEPDDDEDNTDKKPSKKPQDDGERGYTNGKYAN